MSRPSPHAHRRPLERIVPAYDRLAPFYRALEPLFLIFPSARRRGARALALWPGATVLELGVGTGRNLPYLREAVGSDGAVIGLDASKGMLAEASRLVCRRGWSNVTLIHADAARLETSEPLDGVLFGLSYSVMPDPLAAADAAWALLRPGSRLVVLDLGLAATRLRPLLGGVAALLGVLAPGDAYSRPWEELARFGSVSVERFMLGLCYVCSVQKPAL